MGAFGTRPSCRSARCLRVGSSAAVIDSGLDGLAANPHVEVPARYRDEVDELLANGW